MANTPRFAGFARLEYGAETVLFSFWLDLVQKSLLADLELPICQVAMVNDRRTARP